jgi:hypothetical protein
MYTDSQAKFDMNQSAFWVKPKKQTYIVNIDCIDIYIYIYIERL